jgi:hypothetical protein
MKCSNPDCNRSIGLIHYRRWVSRRRYCSRQCRNDVVSRVPSRLQEERIAATYFEWLFLQRLRRINLSRSPVAPISFRPRDPLTGEHN